MAASSNTIDGASHRRRRRLLLVAAGALIALFAVAVLLPTVAAPYAASAIRDALRPEFSESASVECAVSL